MRVAADSPSRSTCSFVQPSQTSVTRSGDSESVKRVSKRRHRSESLVDDTERTRPQVVGLRFVDLDIPTAATIDAAFLVFTVGIGGFRGELERLAAGAGSVYGELSFTFEMRCSDSCVMYLIEVKPRPTKINLPLCDFLVILRLLFFFSAVSLKR